MFTDLGRYAEYRPSGSPEIGLVPSHWGTTRLGQSGRFSKGRGGSREDDATSGGVPCIRYGDLYRGLPPLTLKAITHVSPESLPRYTKVAKGDVLFALSGEMVAEIGKSTVVMSEEILACGGDIAIYRPHDYLDKSFLGYLLESRPLVWQKAQRARGDIIVHVSPSALASIQIPVPPGDEQAAIFRYLAHANRRIDQAIAAKRELIRLLEEQKRVVANRAVVRGLDASASFKDSGVPQIGEIPVHWETAATGRLVSLVTSGSRGWAEYYSDEGPIFLQSGNLGRNLNVDLSRIQRVKLPTTAEGQRTRVMQGDVLVCITGALTGNVAVLDVNLDDEAYVNQHVALLRPITGRIAPKFLGLALHSRPGKEQFKLAEYGGTKQGLGLADVRSVKLALPPLPEQRAILDYLAAENSLAETAISRSLREIDLLREFRTRLIADVVTGQVDVRGIAASLPDVSLDELAGGAEDSMDEELDELAEELAEDAVLA